MQRPKTFTERTIRKLNQACNAKKDSCACICISIGWCDECWHEAFGKMTQDAQDEQKWLGKQKGP